jgi:mRNA-degrading endonuclease toxin of MazEF toxin-antitoxin module
LVVAADALRADDVVLCAITSRVPPQLSPWEIPIAAHDLVEQRLPRPSVVQVGKLFTIHRSLIRSRYGSVHRRKLDEVLARLRDLFRAPTAGA